MYNSLMSETNERGLPSTESLTKVRENLPKIIDEVVETGSEMIISRHGRQEAIILGYEEYESLIETLNILSDPSTMAALNEAENDLESGDLVSFE